MTSCGMTESLIQTNSGLLTAYVMYSALGVESVLLTTNLTVSREAVLVPQSPM